MLTKITKFMLIGAVALAVVGCDRQGATPTTGDTTVAPTDATGTAPNTTDTNANTGAANTTNTNAPSPGAANTRDGVS